MSDFNKRLSEYVRDVKRYERESLKRAREMERQLKEQTKADEKAHAQLEVLAFESRIEVILSIHREAGPQWDWYKLAAALPPHKPGISVRHERRTCQDLAIAPLEKQQAAEQILEEARRRDRSENNDSLIAYEDQRVGWEKLTALARRVVAGDVSAYRDAIAEFSPLAEMEELGSSIEFIFHSAKSIECVISMKDTSVIPSETKSLTASGKLSVKSTPRQRFHEIYQDYICGGMLRVARESFALLPIQQILVTAVTAVNNAQGIPEDKPVLSAIITRSAAEKMNFDSLDPSDTIEKLPYRGDFKATRKACAFQPIERLSFPEAGSTNTEEHAIEELLRRAANLRNELKEELNRLQETKAQ